MKIVDEMRKLFPKKLQGPWLFILALIVIAVLASVKSTPSLGGLTAYDKFNHLAAFFVLSLVFEFCYAHVHSITKILVLIGFGISIEIVQAFIPWRSADPRDVLADTIGITLFYAASLTLGWVYERLLEREDCDQ